MARRPKQLRTSPARFDVPEKTTGAQIYAADVRMPGMVHAAVTQVPVFGGKLVRADKDAVMGRRGIKAVVTAEDWVAVVADNWWRARQALDALPLAVLTHDCGPLCRGDVHAVAVTVERNRSGRDIDAAAALGGARVAVVRSARPCERREIPRPGYEVRVVVWGADR